MIRKSAVFSYHLKESKLIIVITIIIIIIIIITDKKRITVGLNSLTNYTVKRFIYRKLATGEHTVSPPNTVCKILITTLLMFNYIKQLDLLLWC